MVVIVVMMTVGMMGVIHEWLGSGSGSGSGGGICGVMSD